MTWAIDPLKCIESSLVVHDFCYLGNLISKVMEVQKKIRINKKDLEKVQWATSLLVKDRL